MSTMSAHFIELLVSAYQSEQRRQRNAAQAQRKIMNLPPRLRNVHDFILKDLTNRQIARRSGISENTTRMGCPRHTAAQSRSAPLHLFP